MDLESLLYRETGEQDLAGQVQYIDFAHDLVGVVNGFGQVIKHLGHFLGLLKIELIVGEGEAFVLHVKIVIGEIAQGRGGLFLPGVDAKQDVVCVEIILLHIVCVVAGNDLDIVFPGEAYQLGVHLILFGHAMALQLYVVVVLEDI